MPNQILPYDYAPALPMYKQGSMEKQAIIPLLLALGFGAKALWDIGRHDVPGMIGNIRQGNWGGALRNLGSAGANALFAIPGLGMVGRGAQLARAGKGALATYRAGQATRAAKATPGMFSRFGTWMKGTQPAQYMGNQVNRAAGFADIQAQRLMASGAGTRMMPAMDRLAAMRAKGPRWIMNPRGWKDMGKLMGTSVGMTMGTNALANRMGSPEEGWGVQPQQIAYPLMRGATTAQTGPFSAIGNYFRNMPHTGPAEYMI